VKSGKLVILGVTQEQHAERHVEAGEKSLALVGPAVFVGIAKKRYAVS